MSTRPELTDKLFYSIKEFCSAVGISKASFYRLAAADQAPPITKIGDRSLIRAESAAEWAEEQEGKGSGAPSNPRTRPTLANSLFGARR
jgi:predicted DNA-binding transcriptional regulator AlpA